MLHFERTAARLKRGNVIRVAHGFASFGLVLRCTACGPTWRNFSFFKQVVRLVDRIVEAFNALLYAAAAVRSRCCELRYDHER